MISTLKEKFFRCRILLLTEAIQQEIWNIVPALRLQNMIFVSTVKQYNIISQQL